MVSTTREYRCLGLKRNAQKATEVWSSYGLSFWTLGYWSPDFEPSFLGVGFRISGSGFGVQGSYFLVS